MSFPFLLQVNWSKIKTNIVPDPFDREMRLLEVKQCCNHTMSAQPAQPRVPSDANTPAMAMRCCAGERISFSNSAPPQKTCSWKFISPQCETSRLRQSCNNGHLLALFFCSQHNLCSLRWDFDGWFYKARMVCGIGAVVHIVEYDDGLREVVVSKKALLVL